MLNEYQKRGVSVTLRIVEERINDIEQILNSKAYTGILYDTNCNISPEKKEEILKRVSFIKDRILYLSQKSDLTKERRKATSEIFGKLSYCLEIIDNIRAKQLERYGNITNGLDSVLDPHLDIMINLLLEIEHFLQEAPKLF